MQIHVHGFLCLCVFFVGHTTYELWPHISCRQIVRRGRNLVRWQTGPCCTSVPKLMDFGPACPGGQNTEGVKNFVTLVLPTLFGQAQWNLAQCGHWCVGGLKWFCELWSTFLGSKNFWRQIFHTLFVGVRWNLTVLEICPIDTHLLREFSELWHTFLGVG